MADRAPRAVQMQGVPKSSTEWAQLSLDRRLVTSPACWKHQRIKMDIHIHSRAGSNITGRAQRRNYRTVVSFYPLRVFSRVRHDDGGHTPRHLMCNSPQGGLDVKATVTGIAEFGNDGDDT